MRFRTFGCILILSIMVASLSAQTVPNTPFTTNLEWGVGAKAMGMGGAFTAISDNSSALYYNPAGLGQLEHSQVFGSFSQQSNKNESTFWDVAQTEESSFTKFDGIGLAIKMPTSQGSLVLSFGYQRVGSFDGSLFVEDPDLILQLDYNDDGTLEDFAGLYQSYEWLQEGSLTQTSFGVSVEVAPKVFVGGAVNFWGGEKEYTWRFNEIAGVWEVHDGNTGDDYLVMYPDYLWETHYRERYSGANISLGLLASPVPMLTVGGTIKSPVTLKGKRNWDWYEEEASYIYDEALNDYTDDQDVYYDEDEGYIEHKVQSPWVFRGGLALKYTLLTLTGDIELNDYSQLKFKTDPPEDEYNSASEANRMIRKSFKNTMNYHVGGDIHVPTLNASFRAGYAHYESPYKTSDVDLDRSVYSFGLGFNFSEQILLDVAYASTEYNCLPSDVISKEKIKASKFLVTLTSQF